MKNWTTAIFFSKKLDDYEIAGRQLPKKVSSWYASAPVLVSKWSLTRPSLRGHITRNKQPDPGQPRFINKIIFTLDNTKLRMKNESKKIVHLQLRRLWKSQNRLIWPGAKLAILSILTRNERPNRPTNNEWKLYYLSLNKLHQLKLIN